MAQRPANQKNQRSTLDIRNPLVVDTRELGRRPGSMQEVVRTVPAPAELARPLIGVPEGSDLDLELRLESVMEGVLVTCTARATLEAECGRCLDPYAEELEVTFTELYTYPERFAALGADADDDELRVDGDLLDLEQPLRDAVVLELPSSPPCFRACDDEVLAERFGDHGVVFDETEPLQDEDEPDEEEPLADPRWAALRAVPLPPEQQA